MHSNAHRPCVQENKIAGFVPFGTKHNALSHGVDLSRTRVSGNFAGACAPALTLTSYTAGKAEAASATKKIHPFCRLHFGLKPPHLAQDLQGKTRQASKSECGWKRAEQSLRRLHLVAANGSGPSNLGISGCQVSLSLLS